MSWGAELVKIRRLLRDPSGTIWSEPLLRHLYNDVQQDFQLKTKVLEEVVAQRVPQTFHFSYMHDWEWRYLSTDLSQFYQCLSQHDDKVFCHRWEPQEVTDIDSDVSDYGVHFSQPWEAYTSETPGDLVKMRFPTNFNSLKFIAYDEEPILGTNKKRIQSTDPSNVTREGIPIAYYVYDETDNSYVLYPRPSASFDNEVSGDGVAMYADEDTEDTTTGIIAVRSGSSDTDVGVPVDIVDTVNNVFMVYSVSPTEIRAILDESDFPGFLLKYLRFGVVSRAYSANTDGRIRSLGEYWGVRYTLGIEFVKRYLRSRKQDRDYRLTTKGDVARRRARHPRLPDGYPAVDP